MLLIVGVECGSEKILLVRVQVRCELCVGSHRANEVEVQYGTTMMSTADRWQEKKEAGAACSRMRELVRVTRLLCYMLVRWLQCMER